MAAEDEALRAAQEEIDAGRAQLVNLNPGEPDKGQVSKADLKAAEEEIAAGRKSLGYVPVSSNDESLLPTAPEQPAQAVSGADS